MTQLTINILLPVFDLGTIGLLFLNACVLEVGEVMGEFENWGLKASLELTGIFVLFKFGDDGIKSGWF